MHISSASTFVVYLFYSSFSCLLFAQSMPIVCFFLSYACGTRYSSWHIPRCKCILYYLRFNFRHRLNCRSSSPVAWCVVAQKINSAKHRDLFLFNSVDPNHPQKRTRLSHSLQIPSSFMGELQGKRSYKIGYVGMRRLNCFVIWCKSDEHSGFITWKNYLTRWIAISYCKKIITYVHIHYLLLHHIIF